jgi:hypothetical protein
MWFPVASRTSCMDPFLYHRLAEECELVVAIAFTTSVLRTRFTSNNPVRGASYSSLSYLFRTHFHRDKFDHIVL